MEGTPAQLVVAHAAKVGDLDVRRSLPTRSRRSVGAWCFADHLGPVSLRPGESADVAPHPHIGLQTVTWLFEGEFLHLDSLGSEQSIRPGQLNLMSAGGGVAHAEEDPGQPRGRLHGIQLWVAQPEASRWGAAAFEHHRSLPESDLGAGVATVLIGSLAGATSLARRDVDIVGAQIRLHAGTSLVEAIPSYEYAVIGIEGEVLVGDVVVEPGTMAYVAPGRDVLTLHARASAMAMLVGGIPLFEPIVMWWNFVARSRDEIVAAYRSWSSHDERFARVASRLDPIEIAPPAWLARDK